LEHRSITEGGCRHVSSGYVDAIRQLKNVNKDRKTRFFFTGDGFGRRGNVLRSKTGNRVGEERAAV
jgi:hypothetical protein